VKDADLRPGVELPAPVGKGLVEEAAVRQAGERVVERVEFHAMPCGLELGTVGLGEALGFGKPRPGLDIGRHVPVDADHLLRAACSEVGRADGADVAESAVGQAYAEFGIIGSVCRDRLRIFHCGASAICRMQPVPPVVDGRAHG
jgi:hypothetical protein